MISKQKAGRKEEMGCFLGGGKGRNQLEKRRCAVLESRSEGMRGEAAVEACVGRGGPIYGNNLVKYINSSGHTSGCQKIENKKKYIN